MIFTDAEMSNFWRLLHPLKALYPMDVTLLGIVTEVKLLHLWNTPSPIDGMLLGMLTEVKLLHL